MEVGGWQNSYYTCSIFARHMTLAAAHRRHFSCFPKSSRESLALVLSGLIFLQWFIWLHTSSRFFFWPLQCYSLQASRKYLISCFYFLRYFPEQISDTAFRDWQNNWNIRLSIRQMHLLFNYYSCAPSCCPDSFQLCGSWCLVLPWVLGGSSWHSVWCKNQNIKSFVLQWPTCVLTGKIGFCPEGSGIYLF